MSARHNRVKVKLRPSGLVQLRFERRDGWGMITDHFQVSVPRRVLENALRDATIEAPWKDLIR